MVDKKYRNSKLYADQALEDAKQYSPLKTAVVHPVKAYVLDAIQEAADQELIEPVLIGPRERIVKAADEAQVTLSDWELIDTEHSHEAASKACHLAGQGDVSAVMKGALHSSELLSAVIRERALKTERRISHVYAMDVKTYHKPFLMTDAAINVAPDLQAKAEIIQNAINMWRALHYNEELPKVAILAAVETVNPSMQATIDAACLCKMYDRGQIEGGVLDGPLAFDNAISKAAAERKGINSDVAGDPDILVAPDLEAANIMGKQLTFMAEAEAAGLVIGARVPVILTSRSDTTRTRLLSCALALRLAEARKEGKIK